MDAELTPIGIQQAKDLQARSSLLEPELMIVSPMRRSTLTGLLAFEAHVSENRLPVLALESCHEIAGKHTCDKRLPKSELASIYPMIDYSLVLTEEDPYWGDGNLREPLESVARRAADIVAFVLSRSEKHIVIAAHSTILAALMNSVLVVPIDSSKHAAWFGTGEMRTFLIKEVEK